VGLDLLPTDLLTQFYQSLELIPNDNDSMLFNVRCFASSN